MSLAIKVSFAALMLLATIPSSGDTVTAQSAKRLVAQDQQIFDESRGAILEKNDARELVERCGGVTDPKGWKIAQADIRDLEQELAPLLAADLKHVA